MGHLAAAPADEAVLGAEQRVDVLDRRKRLGVLRQTHANQRLRATPLHQRVLVLDRAGGQRLRPVRAMQADDVSRGGAHVEFLIIEQLAEQNGVRPRRKALQQIAIVTKDFTITLTASFGAAGSENGLLGQQLLSSVALEQLIVMADKALYLAKHSGKNQVCVATPA